MNNIELSDDQEGILSFIQMRRPDLHGGLTVGMIAEARRQDVAEAEAYVQDLLTTGLLGTVEPGARTHAPNGEPCYGPTAEGLEWLRKREAEADATMISTIHNLLPKGMR